ncbi:MAG: hypothetical protein UHM16_02310 [Acutalibacteraceae bacterium]|nr:hypothetical protein [Acutalibacteraceae bacterium]
MKYKNITMVFAVCILVCLPLVLSACKKSSGRADSVVCSSENSSFSSDSNISEQTGEFGGSTTDSHTNNNCSSVNSSPEKYTGSNSTTDTAESDVNIPITNNTPSEKESTDTKNDVDKSNSSEFVSLPVIGQSLDERLKIKSISLSGNTVTLEIENTSKLWIPEDDSFAYYTCMDKNNMQLKKEKILLGNIENGTPKTFFFEIPASTAKVELSDLKVDYWSVTV